MFTNCFWRDNHDERIKAEAKLFARVEEKEEDHNPRMTKDSLRKICKDTKLYMTPALNDVLYLHFKGYTVIENLEEYTGLRCIWLENNGIGKIENLTAQTEMRSLYLHYNLVRVIENLGHMQMLDTINLSHNFIEKLENLSCLPNLRTLHMSHNKLCKVADIEHLKECPKLSIVDVSHNHLQEEEIIHVFGEMEELRVLTLSRNPCVSKIKNYRRILINLCKNLKHLDDYPVFDKDRKCAEAWFVGGIEAERDMRDRLNKEEQDRMRASVMAIMSLSRHRYEADEQNERNLEREQRRALGLQDSVDSEGGSSNSTTSDPTPPEDIQEDVENIEEENENDIRSSEDDNADTDVGENEKGKDVNEPDFDEKNGLSGCKEPIDNEKIEEKHEHETGEKLIDDLPDLIKSVNEKEIDETEDDKLNYDNSEILDITSTTINITKEPRLENESQTNSESEQINSIHLTIAQDEFHEIDLNKSNEIFEKEKENEPVEHEKESCKEYSSDLDIVTIGIPPEKDILVTEDEDDIINLLVNDTEVGTFTQEIDAFSTNPLNIVCDKIMVAQDETNQLFEKKWSLLDDEVNQTHIFDIFQEKPDFGTNNLISEIQNDSNQKLTELVDSDFKIPKIIIEEINENECTTSNDDYFVGESPHIEIKNWLDVKPSKEILMKAEHAINSTPTVNHCGDSEAMASLSKDGQEEKHDRIEISQDDHFEENISQAFIGKETEFSPQEKEEIDIPLEYSDAQETMIETNDDSVVSEENPNPNEIDKNNIEKLEDFLLHTDYEPGELMALRKQRKETKFIEKNVAELRKDIKDMELSMLQDKMNYAPRDTFKKLEDIMPMLQDGIMKVLNEHSKTTAPKSYVSQGYDNLIKAHTEFEINDGSKLPEIKPAIPEKSRTFVEFFENTRGSLSDSSLTFPEVLESIEKYNDKKDSIVLDFGSTVESSSDDNRVISEEEEKVSLTTTLELQMADGEED
uniref:Dynein axonemal assembly factor 1 homolog n=1 Tax=Cacopsylla melanoneura TaxID=428564 RepID=A0A8D9AUB3_9HEMI